MNDVLKSKLEILSGDELTLFAIQTVINERLEKESPKVNEQDTDELLGQKTRAYEVSKMILNDVIEDIKNYKKEQSNPKTYKKER